MTSFKMLVQCTVVHAFAFFVLSSLPLCIDGQSWTGCTKSNANWTTDMTPDLVIQARTEVGCISSCVGSVNCTAVRFDMLSRSCAHFYRERLRIVNGTAYESVAFIRNIEGPINCSKVLDGIYQSVYKQNNEFDPTEDCLKNETISFGCFDSVPECPNFTVPECPSTCHPFYCPITLKVNKTKHFFSSQIKVVLVQTSPRYTFTFDEAKAACKDIGGSIMTEQQLGVLQQDGYQLCICAWLSEEKIMFPMQESHPQCGNHIGLVPCSSHMTADVWCTIS